SALDNPVPAIAAGFATFTALNFTDAELAAGLITGPGADPDGDGLSNLFEYAFGVNPRVADAAGVGPAITVNGANHLVIVFRRVVSATDLVYTVESSTNLTTWTPIARSAGGAAVMNLGGAQSVVEAGAGLRTVTVTDALPVTGPGSRFLRLTVTRP
ncbi:MAG: hypothetical protein ABW223_12865, partial [Rariglobus sp.]